MKAARMFRGTEVFRPIMPRADKRICECCALPWLKCSCPTLFRLGCTACVNHCGCAQCVASREGQPAAAQRRAAR